MKHTELAALSPLDGRYAHQLARLRPIFSEGSLFRNRVIIEIRWLEALAACPDIIELPPLSAAMHAYLQQLIDNFSENDAERIKAIEETTRHDVKAVEYWLKEQLAAEPELASASHFLHFACTSEDINNLSYALMLQQARTMLLTDFLQPLLQQLNHLAKEHASIAMLARTHGQAATPTTVGKEFANFAARLERQLTQLSHIQIMGKINGAVGNFNAHQVAYPEVNWPALAQGLLSQLNISYNEYTTQIEPHDFIAELAHCLIRINTILLDFNRDVWAYIALGYFKQANKAGEIGSSTMPHKINPIDFENSEGNLGLANSLLHHFAEKLPISRWQRDLSDSTVLRNLGSAWGYCCLAYHSVLQGLGKIAIDPERLTAELNQHWAVLAEPIQTVMRRYGIDQAYEQLKDLTRGQAITQNQLHDFIQQLALPAAVKQRLLALTPANYLGNAIEQALKR